MSKWIIALVIDGFARVWQGKRIPVARSGRFGVVDTVVCMSNAFHLSMFVSLLCFVFLNGYIISECGPIHFIDKSKWFSVVGRMGHSNRLQYRTLFVLERSLDRSGQQRCFALLVIADPARGCKRNMEPLPLSLSLSLMQPGPAHMTSSSSSTFFFLVPFILFTFSSSYT